MFSSGVGLKPQFPHSSKEKVGAQSAVLFIYNEATSLVLASSLLDGGVADGPVEILGAADVLG